MRSEEKSARGPIEKEGTHEYCECHRVLGNIGHGLGLGPSSHGLFAFLGLLAIVAPFAAPFIRLPWSKYLNAAPLGFLLLSVPKFWWDARQAVGGAAGELGKAAKQGLSDSFSLAWGAYILLIAALVLAAFVLKPPLTAA